MADYLNIVTLCATVIYWSFIVKFRSRRSSVGVVTRLPTRKPKYRVQFPADAQQFPKSKRVQRLRGYVATEAYFTEDKVPGTHFHQTARLRMGGFIPQLLHTLA